MGRIKIHKKWFITGIYNDVESNFDYLERLLTQGQLITLHDIGIKKIDTQSFFNSENFDLLVTSAYWTMTSYVLAELVDIIELIPIKQLYNYKSLLENNLTPYNNEINSKQTREYIQAKYKIEFLNEENATTYQNLCATDIKNRSLILSAINSLIIEKSKPNYQKEIVTDKKKIEHGNGSIKIESTSSNKILSHDMMTLKTNLISYKPFRNYFTETFLQELFFEFLSLLPVGVSKTKYKEEMLLQRLFNVN